MKDGAKPVGQERKRSIATIELYNVILCIRVIKYTSINAKWIFRILIQSVFHLNRPNILCYPKV